MRGRDLQMIYILQRVFADRDHSAPRSPCSADFPRSSQERVLLRPGQQHGLDLRVLPQRKRERRWGCRVFSGLAVSLDGSVLTGSDRMDQPGWRIHKGQAVKGIARWQLLRLRHLSVFAGMGMIAEPLAGDSALNGEAHPSKQKARRVFIACLTFWFAKEHD